MYSSTQYKEIKTSMNMRSFAIVNKMLSKYLKYLEYSCNINDPYIDRSGGAGDACVPPNPIFSRCNISIFIIINKQIE